MKKRLKSKIDFQANGTRAPMAKHRQTHAHAAQKQTHTLPHTATLKDAVKHIQLGQ
jgi:hypothetical protein